MEYDQLEFDTLDELDTVLPGMKVLVGSDDREWTVGTIQNDRRPYVVQLFREC